MDTSQQAHYVLVFLPQNVRLQLLQYRDRNFEYNLPATLPANYVNKQVPDLQLDVQVLQQQSPEQGQEPRRREST